MPTKLKKLAKLKFSSRRKGASLGLVTFIVFFGIALLSMQLGLRYSQEGNAACEQTFRNQYLVTKTDVDVQEFRQVFARPALTYAIHNSTREMAQHGGIPEEMADSLSGGTDPRAEKVYGENILFWSLGYDVVKAGTKLTIPYEYAQIKADPKVDELLLENTNPYADALKAAYSPEDALSVSNLEVTMQRSSPPAATDAFKAGAKSDLVLTETAGAQEIQVLSQGIAGQQLPNRYWELYSKASVLTQTELKPKIEAGIKAILQAKNYPVSKKGRNELGLSSSSAGCTSADAAVGAGTIKSELSASQELRDRLTGLEQDLNKNAPVGISYELELLGVEPSIVYKSDTPYVWKSGCSCDVSCPETTSTAPYEGGLPQKTRKDVETYQLAKYINLDLSEFKFILELHESEGTDVDAQGEIVFNDNCRITDPKPASKGNCCPTPAKDDPCSYTPIYTYSCMWAYCYRYHVNVQVLVTVRFMEPVVLLEGGEEELTYYVDGDERKVKVKLVEVEAEEGALAAPTTPAAAAAPPPVTTRIYSGLSAEFFKAANWDPVDVHNPDCRDVPVRQVNFDWGTGSPDECPGVGADYFYAIFWGKIRVYDAGTYTFKADVDDGVKLSIDNEKGTQQVLSQWGTEGSYPDVQGSITFGAPGLYDLRMDYYEAHDPAWLKLYWKKPGDADFSLVPESALKNPYGVSPTVTEETTPAKPIAATFYDGHKVLSGTPACKVAVEQVWFKWGDDGEAPKPCPSVGKDDYTVAFEGKVDLPEGGQLCVDSDDQFQLLVDNSQAINYWNKPDGVYDEICTPDTYMPGTHDFILNHAQHVGGQHIKLRWRKGPADPIQLLLLDNYVLAPGMPATSTPQKISKSPSDVLSLAGFSSNEVYKMSSPNGAYEMNPPNELYKIGTPNEPYTISFSPAVPLYTVKSPESCSDRYGIDIGPVGGYSTLSECQAESACQAECSSFAVACCQELTAGGAAQCYCDTEAPGPLTCEDAGGITCDRVTSECWRGDGTNVEKWSTQFGNCCMGACVKEDASLPAGYAWESTTKTYDDASQCRYSSTTPYRCTIWCSTFSAATDETIYAACFNEVCKCGLPSAEAVTEGAAAVAPLPEAKLGRCKVEITRAGETKPCGTNIDIEKGEESVLLDDGFRLEYKDSAIYESPPAQILGFTVVPGVKIGACALLYDKYVDTSLLPEEALQINIPAVLKAQHVEIPARSVMGQLIPCLPGDLGCTARIKKEIVTMSPDARSADTEIVSVSGGGTFEYSPADLQNKVIDRDFTVTVKDAKCRELTKSATVKICGSNIVKQGQCPSVAYSPSYASQTKTTEVAGAGGTTKVTTSTDVDFSITTTSDATDTDASFVITEKGDPTFSIGTEELTYKAFDITTEEITEEDIASVTLKFKVDKKWVTANNITIGDIKIYKDGTPLTQFEKVSENSYVYFEATSDSLSEFAVTGEVEAVVEEEAAAPTVTAPAVTYGAKPSRIDVAADGYICLRGTSQGDQPVLLARSQENKDCRILLQFPLDPTKIYWGDIESATLKLWKLTVNEKLQKALISHRTYSAHAITGSWAEGSFIWPQEDRDFEATPASQTIAVGEGGQWYEWDVTSIVVDQLEAGGSKKNKDYGILIKDALEGDEDPNPSKAKESYFASREVTSEFGPTTATPYLELTYKGYKSWTQSDWTGGSGQTNWVDETKYDSGTAEVTSEGVVLKKEDELYASSSSIKSSIYDGCEGKTPCQGVEWDSLYWEVDEPEGTDTIIKLQWSHDKNTWSSPKTQRDHPLTSTDFPTGYENAQYIRYIIILTTTDPSATPTFESITIKYLPQYS